MFLSIPILIYCYTSTEPEKQIQAMAVAQDAGAFISTQVLKELANILRKKFSFDWSSIQKALDEVVLNFEMHINDIDSIKKACRIAQQYQFSFYDSLIISAALESNCAILYSEDLQHDQVIDKSLIVKNPFL